jgi:hypothetical protein
LTRLLLKCVSLNTLTLKTNEVSYSTALLASTKRAERTRPAVSVGGQKTDMPEVINFESTVQTQSGI